MKAFGEGAWRRALAIAAVLVGAAASASAAALAESEQAELSAGLDEAISINNRHDAAACRERLLLVRELAWRAIEPRGFEWPFVWAECSFWPAGQPVEGLSVAQVQALFEPWRERFRSQAAASPLREVQFIHGYWRGLNRAGGSVPADAMFHPELRQWLKGASAEPPDAIAAEKLMHVARFMYGAWELHEYTRLFHGWYRESLGAAHPATLVMQRSLAYGERFHGRAQTALPLAEEAMHLALQHHAHDERLLTGLRAELAQCLAVAGRLAESLDPMLQVRDALLQREPLPMEGLVRTHYNLAGIALEMGDYPAAIGYADQSIDYARRSGVPAMLVEARVPRAIREVARLSLGEADAAQALKAVLVETDVREIHIGGEVFALVRHALQVGDAELLGWSSDPMRRYIASYRTPFHTDRSLLALMDAWQQAGIELHAPQARAALDRAVAGSLTGRSLATESLAKFSLARHLAARQPDEAIWLYKRGANALQQLRTGLPSGSAELHRAWLASHEADLRAFIGLLIDRGRLVEAEQAVRFLRDEEMVEYTRRVRARRSVAIEALAYTGAEVDRNVGLDALAQRVREAATAADRRADGWRTLAPKNRYRDEAADAALAGFQREVHELAQPQAPAGQGAGRARGASTVALPRGVVRLTYFVRDSAIDVLMQRGSRVRSRSLPVTREELNRRVHELRVAVSSPGRDAMAPSHALYGLLVAPLEGWVNARPVSRVQLVPDASLRYVPFAALHDGRRYLAQRFALSVDLVGSAARSEGPVASTGVAAFGRSEGNDEFTALPGVERELAAVGRQRGVVRLNQAFTAESLRSGLERSPAIVHIASHFELSPAGEEKSHLLLGDGRRMSLAELRQLPWQGVQLALLSACDSAVTVDAGNGRELVGFASALLSAGARNVLASLWRVSDGATARWMETFYALQAQPLARPVSPTTLADTQRAWLREHAGSALAHPHYWAAFTWIGTP